MRSVAVALVLLALAAPALAQRGHGQRQGRPPMGPPNIHPLLRKVFDMRNKVKMTGVRELSHLEQGQRKLTTERIYRDGARIKTIVLDKGSGKGMEAVEDSRRRLVWNPELNEIRESAPREAEFFLRFGRMGGKFKPDEGVEESDGGNVAGVPTRQLQFGAPGQKPFSRVWIDAAHGVILKFQTFDKTGNVSGSMEFTSVEFSPTFPPGTFELKKPGARFVSTSDDLAKFARELGMKPYRLPVDDQWKLVGVRKLTPKGVKVLMQTYFGPESRVSLFQIQGSVDAERLRKMEGATTKSYVWTKDGAKLVLIGNRSEEDLRRLSTRVTG